MTFGGLQMLLCDRGWKGLIIWKKKQCAYGNFPQMATFHDGNFPRMATFCGWELSAIVTFRRWELSTDGNFLRMASFCRW